jgi:hypothetical protein
MNVLNTKSYVESLYQIALYFFENKCTSRLFSVMYLRQRIEYCNMFKQNT